MNPNHSFTYNYPPNSNLLSKVTGSPHTVTNTWASDRDVLLAKENKAGNTVISRFDYQVNALGHRTSLATSGTAFAANPEWQWGYNARGEVTKGDSSVNAFDRSYEYDSIGNRKKSAGSLTLSSENNYVSNALNQYSSISNPQSTIVTPIHDADGNMTSGPLPVNPSTSSTLTWDAENRMISTTVNGVTTSYLYDAKFRRIAKTTGATTVVYLYDDWNCIAEYSGNVVAKTRLWGMDLSGSMQGAGGVGGLLSESHHVGSVASYFATYDGNGNVSEYLESNSGVSAHFEYDPFGNAVIDTDTTGSFDYRFSTKSKDTENGLYYYGYRYYDPVTGRWTSRDPLSDEMFFLQYQKANSKNMNTIQENDFIVKFPASY